MAASWVLLLPVLWPGRALFWGTPILQFHPWREFAIATLKSGEWPLWNPWVGMGAPLAANYQSALFYPPHLLYGFFSVFGEGALAWSQGLMVLLHLWLAGLGMVALARSLGLGELAQAISGLAFALSGYLVARAGFLSIIATAAWLPWIFWALHGIAQGPPARRTRFFLWLVLVVGLQLLAGHAQTAWYSLAAGGAFALFSGAAAGPARRVAAALQMAGIYLTAGVFAALLAAIQLLPTFELLQNSARAAGADLDFVMTYSFWPWRFLTLAAPGMFGSPAAGNYWGYGNYWEDAVYIGLLPLVLAGTALFLASRQKSARPLVVFLGGLAAVGFVLGLGKNTPVFPWLYQNIPTFDMFQAPTRYTLWAVFSLALLAGWGAEHWDSAAAGQSRRWFARLAVASLGWVIAGLFMQSVLGGQEQTFAWAFVQFGLLAFAGCVLAYGKPALGSPRRTAWRRLVSLLVTVDLLLAAWGLLPGIDRETYTDPPPQAASLAGALDGKRLFLFANDEYRLKFDRYFSFRTYHQDFSTLRSSYLPNLGMLERLPSANNFDPLLVGRYANWMERLEEASPELQQRMTADMAVGLVGIPQDEGSLPVRFEPIESSERIRWATCAIFAGSAESAWAAYAGLENPDTHVVVEGAPTGQVLCAEPAQPAEIQIIQESANSLHLQVTAPQGGWLVWADTWYPGWQAWLGDGTPFEIYPANTVFRAIFVPEGDHSIRFAYRPVSFFTGLGLSLAAWLAWALSAAWLTWRHSGERNA